MDGNLFFTPGSKDYRMTFIRRFHVSLENLRNILFHRFYDRSVRLLEARIRILLPSILLEFKPDENLNQFVLLELIQKSLDSSHKQSCIERKLEEGCIGVFRDETRIAMAVPGDRKAILSVNRATTSGITVPSRRARLHGATRCLPVAD